jgi:hypothetical protein
MIVLATVIMIVIYDCKTFIAQATGHQWQTVASKNELNAKGL